jgi:hypothetical protein
MRLDELAFGLAVIGSGVGAIVWAVAAKSFDDRWSGERDTDRFARLGVRYDPLPVRRHHRAAGVVVGLALVIAGVLFLAGQ